MKRSEIRTFIKTGVTAVDSTIDFGSGRITEWNSDRSNEYPGVWWESTTTTDTELINQEIPNDNRPITLHVGKLDKPDSSPEQYEELIDECDYMAQQLIHQYSQILTGQLYDKISISGISRVPFIKKHADCVTGVILSFTLNVPDTTNLC